MGDADDDPEIDVEDGCGCAEVWEALSERRNADDEDAKEDEDDTRDRTGD